MIFLQFHKVWICLTPEGSWHTTYTCVLIFLLDISGGNNFKNTVKTKKQQQKQNISDLRERPYHRW